MEPMVTGQPAAARGTKNNEQGSTILEFALVAVVLFVLIFGLIEGGLLVRARNAMNSTADEAARRGAIAANDPAADWMILQQLRARGALAAADVNYVVVYLAADGAALPSETCLAGTPVDGECNVYERADFEIAASAFNCSDAGLDANWCPTDRAADTTAFESLGVWIDATYTGFSHVFGDVGLNAGSAQPIEGSGGV